jgi:hypothetical protein
MKFCQSVPFHSHTHFLISGHQAPSPVSPLPNSFSMLPPCLLSPPQTWSCLPALPVPADPAVSGGKGNLLPGSSIPTSPVSSQALPSPILTLCYPSPNTLCFSCTGLFAVVNSRIRITCDFVLVLALLRNFPRLTSHPTQFELGTFPSLPKHPSFSIFLWVAIICRLSQDKDCLFCLCNPYLHLVQWLSCQMSFIIVNEWIHILTTVSNVLSALTEVTLVFISFSG